MTTQHPSIEQILAQLSQEQVLTTKDQETLEQLAERGYVGEKDTEAEPQATQQEKARTPWYIKGLIGFSAWLSALFMILFLALADIISFRKSASLIVVGVLFLGLGFVLYILQRRESENAQSQGKSIFLNQFALSMTMTGRILITLGLFQIFKNDVIAAFGVIVMEAVVMAVYPDIIQRFISMFVIHGSMLFIFAKWKTPVLTYAYIALMALLMRVIWVRVPVIASEKLREYLAPIGYATAVSLLTITAFSTTPVTRKLLAVKVWLPVTLALAIVWLLICTDIAKEYNVSPTDKLFLVGGATLMLFSVTAYNAPGITASCLIMTLGFYRKEALLVGLAIVALITFVFYYYYGLQISLLYKSIALLIPGIILLVARKILHHLAEQQPTPETATPVAA